MSTKKANKPTRKKMENKQEVTALPSKRELTEAIVTLEQKINQVYASLSMVSNNLIFVLDKQTYTRNSRCSGNRLFSGISV